jgi:hypothetical protein
MIYIGKALVIPAPFTAPVRLIDWPLPPHTGAIGRRTLDILYREIGCTCIDATPTVRTPLGAVTGWSDDVSLLKDQPEFNDRAIAMFRHFGYAVSALAGTIVLTGGADPVGDTLPLPPALCRALHALFTDLTERMQP